MKRIIFFCTIMLLSLVGLGQNITKVLQDIENYKIITLPNGFRIQVVVSDEYKYCNCRLTADVANIDELSKPGIKDVVAALTGSDLIAGEVIVKNMISHDKALDSLMEFLSTKIYTQPIEKYEFDNYKQRRGDYYKAESGKPFKKTSFFADNQIGRPPLPVNYLDNISQKDFADYKNYCFSPQRCLLTILSNMKIETIDSLARLYFANIQTFESPQRTTSVDIQAKDMIYFINDTILSDVASSYRNYFVCQKTPKNYVLNQVVRRLLFGKYYSSLKDFSTYNYDVYSLDYTNSESNFKDFSLELIKPRGDNFKFDNSLVDSKAKVIDEFNSRLSSPDYATEIASYLILYKFQKNFFTDFVKNVNAVSATDASNFINNINKMGSNVLVFNGNQQNVHCAVISLTGERQLDITDFDNQVTFSFEKGFSVRSIFNKYLTVTGLTSPPKSLMVGFSTSYKYLKTEAEYSASGRILRKLPNMYLLENNILTDDGTMVFHYKESFDGVSAYDSTKMYGMQEVDSVRFYTLSQKAQFPNEAFVEKIGKKVELSCDYQSFKDGFFCVDILGFNGIMARHYYNMQTGLKDKVEMFSKDNQVVKTIEYTYSEQDKYLLPSLIKELTFELETTIQFSPYDFSLSPKKQEFFVGENPKKKK